MKLPGQIGLNTQNQEANSQTRVFRNADQIRADYFTLVRIWGLIIKDIFNTDGVIYIRIIATCFS